jgi:hypothetical protein
MGSTFHESRNISLYAANFVGLRRTTRLQPAAKCSVRQVLSWPVLSPSSVATSNRLRPSSTRLTACTLHSGVNRRRVRLSAIAFSWGAGFFSKPSTLKGKLNAERQSEIILNYFCRALEQ